MSDENIDDDFAAQNVMPRDQMEPTQWHSLHRLSAPTAAPSLSTPALLAIHLLLLRSFVHSISSKNLLPVRPFDEQQGLSKQSGFVLGKSLKASQQDFVRHMAQKAKRQPHLCW
jgi:hypothetical protein